MRGDWRGLVRRVGSFLRMVMEQTLRRPGGRPGVPLAVQTAGLTKRFGERTVVDDVALEIEAEFDKVQ